MLKGLQLVAGGEAVGVDLIRMVRDELGGLGVVRADCMKTKTGELVTPGVVRQIVDEIHGAELQPLITVYDAAQLAELEDGSAWVEGRNEPDINHPAGHADRLAYEPAAYVDAMLGLAEAAGARRLPFYGGAIANFNRHSLAWLERAAPHTWPVGVGVSAHWYPHGPRIMDPHPGFSSRDHEVQTFLGLIGDRDFLISETGITLAPRRVTRSVFGFEVPIGYASWSEDEQRAGASATWPFWERWRARAVVWYQINDGPNPTVEERYGLRRFDGSFRPLAATFREF